MKRASAPESVPVFKLYGEQRGWPTPDLLHCESIHQRSSLYAWHIRVHQHAELVQLLYVHKGQAEIEIEGERRAVNGPCIQVVPSLCVHGFRFSPGTQGYVLSLALPLLVWLNRQGAPTAILEDKSARKRSVLRQFARLIESHYREHLSLAEYAQRLGVSTTYLNCLCREFHGTSALGVLHQRLLLEAKRSLQYTSMSITQVSDYLGFSDVTYFSRFFRKRGGMAPKEFKMKIE